MKRKLLLFGLGICTFLISGIFVQAKVCSETEIEAYRQKANEIVASYQFFDSDKAEERYFLTKIFNIDSNYYLVEKDNPGYKYYLGRNEDSIQIKQSYVDSTSSFNFEIYLVDSECYAGSLKNIKVNLPRYNEYADLVGCEYSPESRVCLATLTDDKPITSQEINEVITKAIAESKKAETKDDDKKPAFDNKYYILIGGIGIVIITAVALYFINRDNDIKKRGII